MSNISFVIKCQRTKCYKIEDITLEDLKGWIKENFHTYQMYSNSYIVKYKKYEIGRCKGWIGVKTIAPIGLNKFYEEISELIKLDVDTLINSLPTSEQFGIFEEYETITIEFMYA